MPIYVLWLRQIKRYLRSKSRIIGSLGQPVLFLLGLGLGMGAIYEKAGQGNYIQFLSPGIIAMTILFTGIFSGIDIIWDRQFGFLKETLVAPVPRWQIMIGRTLGGGTIATMQGTLVLLLTFLVGFRPENWLMIPVALLLMVMISTFFTALGTAIASKMQDMQGFQLIMNFLVMPIFFFSGAIAPVQALPAPLKVVVGLNPLAYGVDGIRWCLSGPSASHYGIGLDVAVLTILCFAMLLIGSYFFSKIEI